MVRLSAAGKSTREIANEIGCSQVSVWRQLKKAQHHE
jgi:DNA-binding CsgD family transcriptional regulator